MPTTLWRIRSVSVFFLLAAVPCFCTQPLAVTDEEIFRDFRFNLTNPGARSLALGGAFIALSDDATAALSNPSGLVFLSRPEFFTELRNINGRDSTVFQARQGGLFRTAAATSPEPVLSPSVVSYVYPWERLAIGFSRIEVNKARNKTLNIGALDIGRIRGGNSAILLFRGEGRIETDLSVWNLAGAVKILDSLSFGAALAYGTLDLNSQVRNSIFDPSFLIFPPAPGAGLPIEQTLFITQIDDDDTDVAVNAGLSWRPSSSLSFGLVYRGGYRFELEEKILEEQGSAAVFLFPISAFAGGQNIRAFFNTPDTYGIGAAWRPVSSLTFSLDWVHIEYEDLLRGFQSGLNILTAGDSNADFTVENADEVHFGAEWVFTSGSTPWAIRGGGFTDHNSRLFLRDGIAGLADARTWPERDTEIHYTLGGGAVITERFQIDLAASFSEIGDEYVFSTIFRF